MSTSAVFLLAVALVISRIDGIRGGGPRWDRPACWLSVVVGVMALFAAQWRWW